MKKAAIRIDTPCHADWASMTAADRGRFCGECKKVVHELARMTEREARELLHSEQNGELCVRYVFDAQGNIFFSDSARLVAPSLLNRAKRAALVAAAIAAPMTLGCSAGSSGIDGNGSSGGEMMGGMTEYHDEKQIADDAGDEADAPKDPRGDAGADAADPDAEPSDAASDSYVPPT